MTDYTPPPKRWYDVVNPLDLVWAVPLLIILAMLLFFSVAMIVKSHLRPEPAPKPYKTKR